VNVSDVKVQSQICDIKQLFTCILISLLIIETNRGILYSESVFLDFMHAHRGYLRFSQIDFNELLKFA